MENNGILEFFELEILFEELFLDSKKVSIQGKSFHLCLAIVSLYYGDEG